MYNPPFLNLNWRKQNAKRNIKINIGRHSCVFVVGCAGAPPVVDLSDTIYQSNTVAKTANSKIAELSIKNTAGVGKSLFPLHGDIHNKITMDPLLSATVESDIRRYFEDRLPYDTNSARSIEVKIEQADAYWNQTMSDRLIGIFSINRDRDIGMNFKLSISLQENGKEFASYVHDAPIIIQGKATTQKKITVSYKTLVEAYRAKIFSELDKQIIEKYFVE